MNTPLLLWKYLTVCSGTVLSMTVALMCYKHLVIKLDCFPSFVISSWLFHCSYRKLIYLSMHHLTVKFYFISISPVFKVSYYAPGLFCSSFLYWYIPLYILVNFISSLLLCINITDSHIVRRQVLYVPWRNCIANVLPSHSCFASWWRPLYLPSACCVKHESCILTSHVAPYWML